MTVVNFTKKQNVLTGGSVIFGEAQSTDSRAMGVRTDARTHGHNFEKGVFQNPFLQTKSNKNGVEKNSRALRLARTESIPAVYFYKIRKIHSVQRRNLHTPQTKRASCAFVL